MVFRALPDHPEWVELVTDWLYGAFWQGPRHSRADAADRVAGRMGETPIPRAFVALQDGKPVGTVSLVMEAHPVFPGRRCSIAGLYVPPEFRGQGIGTWLCEEAQAEALSLGHLTLMLYTPDAEGFYLRLGWRTTMNAAITTAQGLQWCVVMEWP